MPQSTLATCSCIRVPKNVTSGLTGTTANSMKAGANASSGARLKRKRLGTAPSGMKSSLKSILRTSAMMCGMPWSGLLRRMGMMEKRARFGPTRSCMSADHLRSAMVSSVAVIITSTRISVRMVPSAGERPQSTGIRLPIQIISRVSPRNAQDIARRKPMNALQPAIVPISQRRYSGFGGETGPKSSEASRAAGVVAGSISGNLPRPRRPRSFPEASSAARERTARRAAAGARARASPGKQRLEHDPLIGKLLEGEPVQVRRPLRQRPEGGGDALRAGPAEARQDALGPRPSRGGVRALRRDGFPRALEAAVPVDQRAVLLVDALARQRDVRFRGGRVLVLGDGDEDFEPGQLVGRKPVGAHGEQRLHAVDPVRDLELHAESVGGEENPALVRVLVGADEEVVGIALQLPAEEISAGAEALSELEGGRGFLVGALGGDGDADAALPGQRLQQLDCAIDGDARAHRRRRVAPAGARPLDAILVRGVVGEPALVAHPDLVHLFVAAREQAVDHVAAALCVDVAAVAAAGAHGRRLVHEPDARLEAEVAAEERAYRADVHGVAAVLAV